MNAYNSIHIEPPTDWQTFERASVILWRASLSCSTLIRYGRSGQRQFGLDLVGYRNGDNTKPVGIQCKCLEKSAVLTEKTIRDEFEKALKKWPNLTEFIFTTTCKDSTSYADIAHKLTEECARKGLKTIVAVWGWEALSQEIRSFPEASNAFNPYYVAQYEALLQAGEKIHIEHEKRSSFRHDEILSEIDDFRNILSTAALGSSRNSGLLERENAELDKYRELINQGKISIALELLEKTEINTKGDGSNEIFSRIYALKGHCFRFMGDLAKAIECFSKSYNFAPKASRAQGSYALFLFLRKQYKDCYEFCAQVIRDDPSNESVVPWLIFSASEFGVENPSNLILNEKVKESSSFCEADLGFLQAHSKEEWYKKSGEYFERFSDNSGIAISRASALIDQIIEVSKFEQRRLLTEAERKIISDAIDILENESNKIKSSDFKAKPIFIEISLNLSTAYLIKGDPDKSIETAKQALNMFPKSEELITRVCQIYFNQGTVEEASSYLKKLENDGNQLRLKILILSRLKQWHEIYLLSKSADINAKVVEFHDSALLLWQCATIHCDNGGDIENRILKIIENFEGEKTNIISIILYTQSVGLNEISKTAYEIAKDAISDKSSFSERANIAFNSRLFGKWDDVIELLEGRVRLDEDTEELSLLAFSFVQQVPVTERGLMFVESLSPEILKLPEYSNLASVLYYNANDLKRAKQLAESCFLSYPENLEIFLFLVSINLRVNDVKAVEAMLKSADVLKLDGTPEKRMELAFRLRDFGREGDAIRLGYNLVMSNPKSHLLAMKYCGLILDHSNGFKFILDKKSLQHGYWFKAIDINGHEQSFYIDDEAPIERSDIEKSDSERSLPFIGKSEGDKINTVSPYGFANSWEVIEVKSIFLQLYQEVIENFGLRFPNSSGFQKITIIDENVQPLIDHLKTALSNKPNFRQIYEETPLPIQMLSDRFEKSTVETLNYLENSGGLLTCRGMKLNDLMRKKI